MSIIKCLEAIKPHGGMVVVILALPADTSQRNLAGDTPYLDLPLGAAHLLLAGCAGSVRLKFLG